MAIVLLCTSFRVRTWTWPCGCICQLLRSWKLSHTSAQSVDLQTSLVIISCQIFWVAVKKVDNLKHFAPHGETDYNPNLIKTLNDSLATLGFIQGQPASQSWLATESQSSSRYVSPHRSLKTKDTTKPQLCSSPGNCFSSASAFQQSLLFSDDEDAPSGPLDSTRRHRTNSPLHT